MSERREAQARGRPREQGEAKERSSRLRARGGGRPSDPKTRAERAEAARRRAIERGRPFSLTNWNSRTEAAV